MHSCASKVVVLISHLQRPRQRSRLAQVVSGLTADYPDTRIEVLDTSVAEALQTARELEQRGEVDVFVCAGATAAYLRKHLARPVLAMRVGGGDLLRALGQAKAHGRQVAVLSYDHINQDLQALAALFTVQVHQAAYTSLEQARQAVDHAARLGCGSIIGSSTVVELAEQAGLQGVLSLSEDTVRKALEEALGILDSQRIEIAKRRHLDAVLQHIPTGVAAVDNQGLVQSLNPALAQLLGLPASAALGRPLQALCPELDLQQALQDGTGEDNRVIRLGAQAVVSNLLPILENGERTGLVLTCQDISAVQRADQRIRASRRPGAFTARYRLEQLSGNSRANREMLQLAERFAASHSTILITGESGTGKELLAQGIHNASPRRQGPFVAINCAAFPETLLESELFGYEEGAFSGSRKGGKPGLFEAAHRGTLFLDEIGDMPVSLQTRLLRVLQEREVLRLGSTEPIAIDVRIIAATHQDLGTAIDQGRFRTDLYYRLNILRLQTTPLRERPEDIALICRSIGQRLLVQGQPPGAAQVVTALLPYLVRHAWPGNVRELENVIERAMLSARELLRDEGLDEQYLARVLPELCQGQLPSRRAKAPQASDLQTVGKAAQLRHVQETLDSCQGDLDEAARRLGISRTTLWRRLRAAR
ncbi:MULTISPECIES: propionate catabolism operon regulatory protein PrpR [unclassified Pseudomonas]|uniref:propionate catabolism operon regulatory protein PrpR n=1 Tax=unclassified Pseudomonas TaxID=196821 RepID=UPI000C87EE7E|nr:MULTISPECIES: propionate catabolism operon regulatory protein PrpR [unclassified Pseudomonas]PNA01148.1 propionate catabolism operon regulatory protein PrpR [Pseudomonas sp. FW305-42]PNA25892.1 propionate catabolism operon regulatory protein PrpR [Pseudomonas sp. MPR-R1B]PNB27998.1 propionate catabolism operon regulatory protein PrpR [Pseudomonas sp. DP16D-E2]PNB44925.1 propionate catabolism operon regulatory protein PrpR [Pseudomonas sp. FW305-17]PNB64005.1 propionate catabolism operon reg